MLHIQMPDRPPAPELTRREFLRRAVAAPLGGAIGATVGPLLSEAERNIAGQTSIRAGDPEVYKSVREWCGGQNTPPSKDCLERTVRQPQTIARSGVAAPITAEGMYRVFPSYLLDSYRNTQVPNVSIENNIVWGDRTQGPLLTRREVATVAITAGSDIALRNLAHPPTERRLPIAIAAGHGVLWYLQRRFGFFANSAAAIVGNLIQLPAVPKKYGR